MFVLGEKKVCSLLLLTRHFYRHVGVLEAVNHVNEDQMKAMVWNLNDTDVIAPAKFVRTAPIVRFSETTLEVRNEVFCPFNLVKDLILLIFQVDIILAGKIPLVNLSTDQQVVRVYMVGTSPEVKCNIDNCQYSCKHCRSRT